jgi:ribosomal protein S18 acetylase RimI-like enzyme
MTAAEFAEFLERSIARKSAKWVERGIWAAEDAVETCRRDYAEFLPQGSATPHHRFCWLVAGSSEDRVGEVWYMTPPQGGKVQFWVNWLAVDPEHRRHGYATEALRLLEEEARRLGADRALLTVWADNPGAMALYAKLGYVPSNLNLVKRLSPPG